MGADKPLSRRPRHARGAAARVLLLAAALLAAAAAPRPAAAAPPDVADFLPALEGRTLVCARFLDGDDGFVRNTPEGKDRIKNAKDGDVLPLSAADIVGYNIDTLNHIAAKARDTYNTSFDFEFVYYKVPKSVIGKGEITDPEVLEHVTTKFDCALESLQVKTERAVLVNFMTPNFPFGYTLAGPGPKLREVNLWRTLTNFLRPFTWQVWLTIIGLWLVSAAAILVFENGEEYGAFGDRATRRRLMRGASFSGTLGPRGPKGYKKGLGSHTWANKLGYVGFSTWLAFTSGHFITPVSAAGRIYTMVLCFVFLALVSAYTANLATIFTTAALPVQAISNINDAVAQGARVCIKDSKTHIRFMQTVFPQVKLQITDGEERQVLEAVERGQCSVGVSSNAHFSYFLSTNQSWCDLRLIGQPLSIGYYSIAFGRIRTLSKKVVAINVLLTEAIEKAELHPYQERHFPETEKRLVCGAQDGDGGAKDATLSLTIKQTAGVFALAAAALVVCWGLHATLDARRRERENTAEGLSHIRGGGSGFGGASGSGLDGGGKLNRGGRSDAALSEVGGGAGGAEFKRAGGGGGGGDGGGAADREAPLGPFKGGALLPVSQGARPAGNGGSSERLPTAGAPLRRGDGPDV
ncbi:hypothetical protein Rsub_12657 [Raphidocelis subcapitata]|uniref:Ionotropic glutamate receptor C-terminal domain-containing protein n=1 Tax=Raphidocelis subcapitata TaxID=307507 RepID=A0A2V0PJI7_9CHLO|nr:hypothetical protein Rsub_12657 [Raphidocelis subcapitata]|eukprot:GBF99964.1 hypothetical protein Rsub_12657 [Raphidocelis subcapitata]